MTDPAGQKDPAVHTPLQFAEAIPGTDPYSPAVQLVHELAAARLYFPAVHMLAIEETEPAGQLYPGGQGPPHTAVVNPDTLPK